MYRGKHPVSKDSCQPFCLIEANLPSSYPLEFPRILQRQVVEETDVYLVLESTRFIWSDIL